MPGSCRPFRYGEHPEQATMARPPRAPDLTIPSGEHDGAADCEHRQPNDLEASAVATDALVAVYDLLRQIARQNQDECASPAAD